MRYEHVVAWMAEQTWAILPEKLAAISELVALKAAGRALTEADVALRIGAASRPVGRVEGSVAVLPLWGVVAQRLNLLDAMSGGTSTEQFAAAFRQALADPNIGGIVITVDSPGGSVYGVPELAAEILRARGQKSVVAVADSLMASAAYWIGSAAEQLYVTPGGEVGSIGILTGHADMSQALANEGVTISLISAGKYKTEGNPYGPLTDEARAAIQARVDEYYGMFVGAVAKGRGVPASQVRNGFGEGRLVGADAAERMGMVDGIKTLDQVLTEMTSGRKRKPGMGADAGGLGLEARKRRLRLAGS